MIKNMCCNESLQKLALTLSEQIPNSGNCLFKIQRFLNDLINNMKLQRQAVQRQFKGSNHVSIPHYTVQIACFDNVWRSVSE